MASPATASSAPGAAPEPGVDAAPHTLDIVKAVLNTQQPAILAACAHIKNAVKDSLKDSSRGPPRKTADLSAPQARELVAVATWLQEAISSQTSTPPPSTVETQIASLTKTVNRNTSEMEKMRTAITARATFLEDAEDEDLVDRELGGQAPRNHLAGTNASWATASRRLRPSPPKTPLEQRMPASECLLKKTGVADPAFTNLTPALQVSKLRECIINSSVNSPDTAVPAADVLKIIRAIRPLPSGDLIICSLTPEHSATFRSHASSWLPHLTAALHLHTPSWGVVVHRLPTSFDPHSDISVAGLRAENEDLIPAGCSIQWLSRKLNTPSPNTTKKHSSIVIHLPSPELANLVLQQGIAYDGRLLRAERVMRSPPQCWRCQKYGHVSLQCKQTPSCSL